MFWHVKTVFWNDQNLALAKIQQSIDDLVRASSCICHSTADHRGVGTYQRLHLKKLSSSSMSRHVPAVSCPGQWLGKRCSLLSTCAYWTKKIKEPSPISYTSWKGEAVFLTLVLQGQIVEVREGRPMESARTLKEQGRRPLALDKMLDADVLVQGGQ